MKAEHRKELETNALADGVGGIVQRVRTGRPERRTYTILFVAIAFVIALWFVWRLFQVRAYESAENWFLLEDGTRKSMETLRQLHPETNPGKAARLELAYITLWEYGIKLLGSPQLHSDPQWRDIPIRSIDEAYRIYSSVRKDSEGDPIFEPEAIFGMAVIEETRTALDRKHLDKAKELYKELADGPHKSSAYGKLATQRLAQLDDPRQRNELLQFYLEMRANLDLREPAAERPVAPRAKPAEQPPPGGE